MSLDKFNLEREALAPDLARFLRETGDHVIKPHLDGLTKIRWLWLVKCLMTAGLVVGSVSVAYFVIHGINGFFAWGLSEFGIASSVTALLAVWFVLWLKPWINDTDLEAD